jgi:hypothetical protein
MELLDKVALIAKAMNGKKLSEDKIERIFLEAARFSHITYQTGYNRSKFL